MYYSQKKNTYAGVSFYLKLQPFNLQRVILLKEDLRILCFSMNFAKFLRTSFLKTTLGDCFWTKEYPCETRSSHRRCSIKVVLKSCFKFTGRHLCKGVLLNKVAGLGLQLYYKRDSGTDVFQSTFFCRTPPGWLLLPNVPLLPPATIDDVPKGKYIWIFHLAWIINIFLIKIILAFTRSLLEMKTHEDVSH